MRALAVQDDDGVTVAIWSPGTLRILRDWSSDRDVWLIPDRPDSMTYDLFGVPPPGLHRVPYIPVDRTWVLSVSCPRSPFGTIQTNMLISGQGYIRRLASPITRPIDIALVGDYGSILHWLHGDRLLGNLLIKGDCLVEAGDFLALSSIEGIVSLPDEDGRYASGLASVGQFMAAMCQDGFRITRPRSPELGEDH